MPKCQQRAGRWRVIGRNEIMPGKAAEINRQSLLYESNVINNSSLAALFDTAIKNESMESFVRLSVRPSAVTPYSFCIDDVTTLTMTAHPAAENRIP